MLKLNFVKGDMNYDQMSPQVDHGYLPNLLALQINMFQSLGERILEWAAEH